MVKKAAAIGMILIMALSLGACSGKGSSGKDSSGGNSAPTSGKAAGAELQGGENTDGAAGANMTEYAAGGNMTGIAGENMTGAAGGNMTGAAGGNMTGSTAVPNKPVLLDPPSMKTAYRPETEDEKFAREITGIYLLTDLKDTLSEDTGEKAAKLEDEGEPMYLEFYGNGTVQETVFGDQIGGLWDREYLTIGSDRIPYSLEGDHVTVMTDHMNLTFTRTTQEELDLLLSAGSGAEEEENESGAEEENGQSTEDEGDPAVEEYTEEPAGQNYAIEDNAIQDQQCNMTITGYDFSDPRGFVIHVLCENYEGFRMAFNITDAVVNNIMFEPGTLEEDHWTLEVEPMSSRESDIVFRADKAAEYGITSFDYVLLNLWVRNLDDWMDDPVYMGDEELYPTGKVTGEGLQVLTRRTTPEEKKIEEQSKFIFTILGTEQRENGDYVLKACIENNTWQNLMFSWDDVYVNGELLDPFWAAESLPHTIRYEDIVFPARDLEEHGVGSISDITFTMSAYDSRDWLSYPFYAETSTYRP